MRGWGRVCRATPRLSVKEVDTHWRHMSGAGLRRCEVPVGYRGRRTTLTLLAWAVGWKVVPWSGQEPWRRNGFDGGAGKGVSFLGDSLTRQEECPVGSCVGESGAQGRVRSETDIRALDVKESVWGYSFRRGTRSKGAT